MPTTRSQAGGNVTFSHKAAPRTTQPSKGTKRKTASSQSTSQKSLKQAKIEPETGNVESGVKYDTTDDSVTINRAPVLELWAASVAHTLHTNLSWQTCLSIGGAVSTIGAISKGRSIGTIDKPSKAEQQEKKQKPEEMEEGTEEVHVMSFHLKLNEKGEAVVGDKPKKANEEALRNKFSTDYEKVKDAMAEAISSWKGNEEELNRRAFHMYEDFRPSVPSGQKGWGRKGELSLKKVKDAVSAG